MSCSIPVKSTEMNGTVLPALEISGVSKSYGTLKAVRNVRFSVSRGEFFGLLGPNGAGKTTLINSLAGLCRIDQGFIKVMGHDVKKTTNQPDALWEWFHKSWYSTLFLRYVRR